MATFYTLVYKPYKKYFILLIRYHSKASDSLIIRRMHYILFVP